MTHYKQLMLLAFLKYRFIIFQFNILIKHRQTFKIYDSGIAVGFKANYRNFLSLTLQGDALPVRVGAQFGGLPGPSQLLLKAQMAALVCSDLPCAPIAPIPVPGGNSVMHSLDYCNVLYIVLLLKSNQELQLVQNATASAFFGISFDAYVTPLLH